MYDFPCQYCTGTVAPKVVASEVFKHKNGFVMLENVTIGVCDTCGNRYYSADILHAVNDIASGLKSPEKTVQIPVGHAA